MSEQRTDAELRAQFPYHGETLACVRIATQITGNVRYYRFTIDRTTMGIKDTLSVSGNHETIKLFLAAGIQYDTQDDYAILEPKFPIPVTLIHDEKDNRPRINAVHHAGKIVKLGDEIETPKPAIAIKEPLFKHNGKLIPESEYRKLKALEKDKQIQENVGTPYIPETGDSLPELLAQLDTICDKLNKIWQEDGVKVKTNAYGSNKMKRMIIGRIWQDIDALIRISEIKDLRRKKAE